MQLASMLTVLALGACAKNDKAPEVTGSMTALTIPVDGMACERCASRVKGTLTASEGVGDADVDLDQKRVVLHFDPHRTSGDKLVSAIDGAGFKAGTPHEVTR